jgi:Amt family ammonium transporter
VQAVKAFLNTNTACATAMIVWVLFDCLRGHKPSGMGAAVGAVIGLVAITPSAGWVSVGQSICIAVLTTSVCYIAVHWKNKTSVDDALDVFPTHGVGGIFGTVLTGIFVYETTEITYFQSFIHHILALVIVCGYTFVVTFLLYWITNKMIPFRVSEENETIGLDKSQHDEIYGMGMFFDDEAKDSN